MACWKGKVSVCERWGVRCCCWRILRKCWTLQQQMQKGESEETATQPAARRNIQRSKEGWGQKSPALVLPVQQQSWRREITVLFKLREGVFSEEVQLQWLHVSRVCTCWKARNVLCGTSAGRERHAGILAAEEVGFKNSSARETKEHFLKEFKAEALTVRASHPVSASKRLKLTTTLLM